MQPETVIPLFPLGLVLLPQMPLPLHIFEERYKLMIGTIYGDFSGAEWIRFYRNNEL
jgi:Lon protease-like protein